MDELHVHRIADADADADADPDVEADPAPWSPRPVRVVLVGGHESDGCADLVRLEARRARTVAVRPGRRLHDVTTAALDAGETVVAVPMTFGRDPAMVADTARTLRWVADRGGRGSVALAAPFGAPDHLTARLRAAAGAVHARDPGAALVVAARSGGASDDAELHRIAHLVRADGARARAGAGARARAGTEVVVATLDRDPDIAPVLDRLRRLGFLRTVVVPAGFAAALDVDRAHPAYAGMRHAGPLVGDVALVRIVGERVDAALHDLGRGHDGIEAALSPDQPQHRSRRPAGSPRPATAPATPGATPAATPVAPGVAT